MGTYDSADLRGLAGLGRNAMRGYGWAPEQRIRGPVRIVAGGASPTITPTGGTKPLPTLATPTVSAPPVLTQSGDVAALRAQVADLANRLAKKTASEAALTDIIRNAQTAPKAGEKPSGLQQAFAQIRAVNQDLQTKLAKKTASEAALTETIRTAQQPPAPGKAPTGLQQAFGAARAKIAELEAWKRAHGG